jgi:hypothetical protein
MNNITKKGDCIEALRRAEHDLSLHHQFLTHKLEQESSIQITPASLDEKVNIGGLYHSLVTTA